jgi:hypothetical protein
VTSPEPKPVVFLVAGHGLVVVADHVAVAVADEVAVVVVADDVAVAADVAVADRVLVTGHHGRALDVAARGDRAVAGGDHGVDVDVLVEVAAVGVDLLVDRVVGDGVAVVDGGELLVT